MRVLFLNPRFSGGTSIWISIGLLSIASFIREHGVEVKILDNNLIEDTEAEARKAISEFQPDIVGITGMTVQLEDALSLGKLVKEIADNTRLVYGGVHFTFKPEDGLRHGDIVVIGEGEETFYEICNGRPLAEIKGIAYNDGDKIIRTEKREPIKDLDQIPFPAYDLVNIGQYDDRFITGEKAISMMTGRGCPFDCVFCASPQLYQRKVRYHSIDYVIEHVDYLRKNYGLENLRIMDDTFAASKKRVMAFCDAVTKLPYNINMTCLTHVKTADYEMFRRMKEAGFSMVAFGVESGSQVILELVNKKITKDKVREAVAQSKAAGLDAELLFMIGNIGETEETIEESIQFAKELDARYSWFQFAVPFPGSRFYETASQYGDILTYDTREYHHQEPVFVPFGLTKEAMMNKRQEALNIKADKSTLEVEPESQPKESRKSLSRKFTAPLRWLRHMLNEEAR